MSFCELLREIIAENALSRVLYDSLAVELNVTGKRVARRLICGDWTCFDRELKTLSPSAIHKKI
jgi:hypothetical protein